MATLSKKVLIDASAFFAFVDRNHPKHSEASAYFRYFANQNYHLYTCSFVVTRTYDEIRRNISYALAKEFLRLIYLGNIEIIYPDDSWSKAAIKLVLGNTGLDFGVEHALVNVIADRRQIPQICSFENSSYYFGIQPFALPY